MPTVLRLDPAHPPLWRNERLLQFGVDAVAVIEDPRPWQQRLLRELEHGITESALDVLADDYGVTRAEVHTLVGTISRAVRRRDADASIAKQRVVVQTPHDPGEEHEPILAALVGAGLDVEVEPWCDPASIPHDRRTPVLLVAHFALDPRRAATALRDDVCHLPVVLAGDRVTVGPLVVPGVTACLACVAAHRRSADPAWPMLAAQLLGRAPAPMPNALAYETGSVAAHLIRPAWSPDPSHVQHSVTLSANSPRRSWHANPPHAECGCRSLQESATADGDCVPDLATRSPREYELPA